MDESHVDATALTKGRARNGLSVYSILLIMLLSVSFLSSLVVGVIGYLNGTGALDEVATNRLVEIRESRAREVEGLFETVENTVRLAAMNRTTTQAVREFSAGFAELQEAELDPADAAAVKNFFTQVFATRLSEVSGGQVDPATFMPTAPAAIHLQRHYTVPFDSWEDAISVNDAGDGSDWSEAHVRHHPYFRAMTEQHHFEDVLLIDASGNVVYTAYKGIDLGTSLISGSFRLSNLAEAFREAMSRNIIGDVVFADFAAYAPSLGTPAGWAVTPIVDDGEVLGALAIELPVERINEVMTVGGQWQTMGLAQTGESYLVGRDKMMRSTARPLLEDAEGFRAAAIAAGLDPTNANLIMRNGDTLLHQTVHTDAVARAMSGESGTLVGTDYLGREVVTAFAPISLGELSWIIIAQQDSAEALAPIDGFTRNLLLSTALMIVLVCMLSLVLAQVFVRPLRRLKQAAQRIAAGEDGVQVDAGSSDELADLAEAFNDMSRSLEVKSMLIAHQERENEKLMLSFMPEAIASRYKEGAPAIAQDFDEVTVIFADIIGFDEMAASMSSEEAIDALNDIVRSFDDAAEQFGVERVRTTRRSYLASCGLSVSRVDHARRGVDFAVALESILGRWNVLHGGNLHLRAGLDCGRVTTGLIGRARVVYDMWGDTVNLAFRVPGESAEPGIYLTQRVADQLPDTLRLLPSGEVTTSAGAQRVWRVDPAITARPAAELYGDANG